MQYDIVIPKNISSLPDNTNRLGGFCSRALINLVTILTMFRTEKIKRNKNSVSKLTITQVFFYLLISQLVMSVVNFLTLEQLF